MVGEHDCGVEKGFVLETRAVYGAEVEEVVSAGQDLDFVGFATDLKDDFFLFFELVGEG